MMTKLLWRATAVLTVIGALAAVPLLLSHDSHSQSAAAQAVTARLAHAAVLERERGEEAGGGADAQAYTDRAYPGDEVSMDEIQGALAANDAATTHGACVVIPAPTFDPVATLSAVERERCTSLYGVPTMFISELALPDFATFDLSSLRTGIMAGSLCPVEVMRRVVGEMHMREVSICYGMTETSPVSTQTRPDDGLMRRTSTVGRVLPHVEVKIVDPATGATVPHNTRGELCTRGYSVMLGYWQEPERTAEAIDSARWMHTGDLAVMDDKGYVQIVGRMKDMIVRGGENVYPREIEEFLHTHPKVADVQVVGVPDEKYGEEILACVILREGARTLTRDELARFCRGRLAHYKVPRYLRLMDAFPMTVSGKVRKVELREAAARELLPETRSEADPARSETLAERAEPQAAPS